MRKPHQTLHVTTADEDDISRAAVRAKASSKKPIYWKEARRRAWAWVRAMSGISAWPEPTPDDDLRIKRKRARPKRLSLPAGYRKMLSSPWWQIKMNALRTKRKNAILAGKALAESAEIRAKKEETP